MHEWRLGTHELVNDSISYLGWRDVQVKIRGLRVEMEEVEEVLKSANDSIIHVIHICHCDQSRRWS